MDTSLKAARDYVYNDRSWASTGKTLDKRVNTCLLRALRDIAGEVPEALLPEDHHVHVRKNIIGSDATINAKIKMTTDLKVLQFVRSGSWFPDTDGFWNGVMYLEITDPDNRVRRRRAREWWESGGVYYVSIDRPWFDTGANEMDFRIYQPSFYLPANTIEVLTPLRLFDDSEQLIGQISSGTARREYLPDFRQRVSGRPTDFWRGEFQQLPSPTEAPKVSSIQSDAENDQALFLRWKGPVQEGKFEFCYTYAWGRKEQEWGESTGGFSDPQFESAPSPVSAVFDHAVEVDQIIGRPEGRAIVIECRNLEEMLDFVGNTNGIPLDSGYTFPAALPGAAPLRYGRSGIKIRVYVRRLATYEDHGPSTTAGGVIKSDYRLNRVEADEKFYLLAELEPLEQNSILDTMTTPVYKASTFVWQGTPSGTDNNIAPDPTRQLRKTTGYYAYNVWPIPDQDYDIDVPLLRQPKELVNDNDQLPIKQEAFSAYMELALAYMSRLDGVDQNSEIKHRALYRQLVRRFRSQHGDNNGIVENKAWGDIRPRYRYGTFQEG
jgi:hypothetical protein